MPARLCAATATLDGPPPGRRGLADSVPGLLADSVQELAQTACQDPGAVVACRRTGEDAPGGRAASRLGAMAPQSNESGQRAALNPVPSQRLEER